MTVSAGEMLLEAFKNQGIEYIFCSPGTEWVPVWEGLTKLYAQGEKTLKYINCRHESLAVTMASGYATATGRLPAVLLHASVGPLHGSMAIRAAYRARVPMIICTGESSRYGEDGTSSNAHWLSRLSDIGGPIAWARSFVKWSNSATSQETLLDSVYRGCQIAQTAPRGPVFLSIPWEFLLQSLPEVRMTPPSPAAALPAPRPRDLEEVAKLLVESKQPIIITEHAGRNPENVSKLIELAELLSIPVFQCLDPACGNFPRNHPLHAGYDASEALQEADTVFVVGGNTPWHPPSAFPQNGARVILLDENPLQEHLPYWGFRVDLLLTAEIGQWLTALVDTIRNHINQPEGTSSRYEKRFEYWRTKHEQLTQSWEKEALAGQKNKPISAKWLLYTLSKILPGNSIIVNETITHRHAIQRYLTEPDSYFRIGSGLGMGMGAAAGVKLAHQDRPVVFLVGDGTFNYNPVLAGLGLYQEYGLPVLIIVLNNGGYIAMGRSHRRCYPEGWAVSSNTYLGVDIAPEPDYVKIAEAFDAYGQRVAEPDEIEPAVTKALQHIAKGKAALLNVILDPQV